MIIEKKRIHIRQLLHGYVGRITRIDSVAAGLLDDLLHVVEILLQSLAPC